MISMTTQFGILLGPKLFIVVFYIRICFALNAGSGHRYSGAA